MTHKDIVNAVNEQFSRAEKGVPKPLALFMRHFSLPLVGVPLIVATVALSFVAQSVLTIAAMWVFVLVLIVFLTVFREYLGHRMYEIESDIDREAVNAMYDYLGLTHRIYNLNLLQLELLYDEYLEEYNKQFQNGK